MIRVLAIMAALAGPASAGCAPHRDAIAELRDNYAETAAFIGMTGDGQLLQLYSNRHTGTWTVLIVSPKGAACGVASGNHGYVLPAPAPGEPG